jgi:hypothetical protein
MWAVDLPVQKLRGAVQGWRRGYYKHYSFQLPPKCLGRDTTKYLYYIEDEFTHFDFQNILSTLGLFYNLYYMFDYECQIEQWAYDYSVHCFNHNCEPEQLLKNEMAHVFQVTGALNALAAIYYEEEPKADQHQGWFDMYVEVGMATGKLYRYTMLFDPRDVTEPN